jgi:cytochrome bd-type quinol oxidase subunit 2
MKFVSKKIYLVFVFALLLSFFFVANFCFAAFLNTNTQDLIQGHANVSAVNGGYETSGDIYALSQTIINGFLALVGVILLAYLLSAGYKWMTAHGEEEKVTEAKDTIKRAIVGVIIIVAAYAISVFVMFRLQQGILKNGTSTPTPPAATVTH